MSPEPARTVTIYYKSPEDRAWEKFYRGLLVDVTLAAGLGLVEALTRIAGGELIPAPLLLLTIGILILKSVLLGLEKYRTALGEEGEVG